jgi:hypothetical protein
VASTVQFLRPNCRLGCAVTTVALWSVFAAFEMELMQPPFELGVAADHFVLVVADHRNNGAYLIELAYVDGVVERPQLFDCCW